MPPFEGQGWGLEIPRLAPMEPNCSILVIKPVGLHIYYFLKYLLGLGLFYISGGCGSSFRTDGAKHTSEDLFLGVVFMVGNKLPQGQ